MYKQLDILESLLIYVHVYVKQMYKHNIKVCVKMTSDNR